MDVDLGGAVHVGHFSREQDAEWEQQIDSSQEERERKRPFLPEGTRAPVFSRPAVATTYSNWSVDDEALKCSCAGNGRDLFSHDAGGDRPDLNEECTGTFQDKRPRCKPVLS